MEIKRGIPVSPGVAIGPALVVDTEGVRIPRRNVDKAQVSLEIQRLQTALAAAGADARANQQAISDKLGEKYGAIFAAHAMLIEDPELVREIELLITQKLHAAEYAVSRTMRRHAKALASLNQPIFSQRSSDLIDIEKSVLAHLVGRTGDPLQGLQEPAVILAHDLTPSQTANLDPKYVYAFATEAGGKASHTAIMAGVLEIPAVVGLGRLLMDVSGGDEVIVDGNRGVVILNPDEETRERYLVLQKQFGTFAKRLDELRDLPAETKDGTRAVLLGNIEFPQESDHCNDRGADGVGLYRTEFLYLNKTEDPNESEQYEAYMSVLRAIGSKKPVVIRTLDLGADKLFHRSDIQLDEKNPVLGMRSVRLCLRNLALFKTQLRAILRASFHGDVRIMFPMVSTLMELRQCKMILADVKEELDEERIDFNRKILIGTMIEVPSVALMAAEMAKEVNFFSIGTNDLIQYTLAADRTNEHVASLYNAGDPSVLRLIDHVIRAAGKQGIEVCVCGEMSGDPIYTILLLGLGLRQLSMTPQNIPEIKKIIRSINIEEANQAAQEALRFETAREVNNYLREQTRRILPEVVVN
ncbi:MAG: phosphoenolpyruvate--protein phosphotransferase [Planctomycetes bacterium]|nr:phosphoenolpyruvate--protein phosphotransferase [Planctomycetota bacterium]